MYDDILVPTDGSTGAESAARHALTVATAFESRVHLLSVVDERSYTQALADLAPEVDEQRAALEGRAGDAVDRLETLFVEHSVRCGTAVEHGIPHEAISHYADDHEVDLVVMGTHGRTGLDRWLLGSVTERVVRTSDVPVLTARSEPDNRSSYDRILLPTDGSAAATAAIAHATTIAEQFDATVHALSVVSVGAAAGAYDAGAGLPGVIDALREGAHRAVDAVAEECGARDVDVVTVVREGTPHRAIGEYIDDEGIDLVAMGTQGRTGLERYLIGSVTERTVRTSGVPVLTVRERVK